MRILFTGASSFTGYWFAKTLVEQGHEVTAILTKKLEDYSQGIRSLRVNNLAGKVSFVDECKFGSEKFLKLIDSGFDIICHHAANVKDYKSLDFDIQAAFSENTQELRAVLTRAKQVGVRGVVLTGSVFEANEGIGDYPLRAFSAYGLSKSLTYQLFSFYCNELEIPLAKFVIPNPFGPYEEERFCSYLINTWRKNEIASVGTPMYLRDNIHVDILANCYAYFTSQVIESNCEIKMSPSGYVESQGAFAERFAREARKHLNLKCELQLNTQNEFREPLYRINSMPAQKIVTNWTESLAWENYFNFYS